MTDDQLRRLMVDRFGVRLLPHSTRYLLEQLAQPGAAEIPVIGADARTGRAVHKLIAAKALQTGHSPVTRPSDPAA